MTDAVMPAPPAQGLLARAIGILTSPRRTFQGVVSHPLPIGIAFLSAVVIALATGLPQFSDRGRQAVLDMQVQQIEKFTGQPVSDEMYTTLQARSKYSAYWTLVSVFIFVPIGAIVFAGIYWGWFNVVLGGTASFKQVLAISTHTLVIGALAAVLAAPIQYLTGTMSTSGPFNLAALVPMLPEKSFLVEFLSFINPFTVWSIVVTAIGLSVLYKRKASRISMWLLGIYVLLIAAIATYLASR